MGTVEAARQVATIVLWLLVSIGMAATESRAVCNAIPAAFTQFQATRGIVDRPFAGPGDWVGISGDPSCGDAGATFGPSDVPHAVVLVLKPPTADRRAVVVASACTPTALPSCAAAPQSPACCVEGDVVVDGPPTPRLRFRYPDTDALVADPGDDLTLTGPTTIAVVRLDDGSLPAAMTLRDSGTTCADVQGLVACVDGLFVADGTCTPTIPHPTFRHFTTLPALNSFAGLCSDGASCRGDQPALRMAVDEEGHVLVPMSWQDVLVDDTNGVPVPLLLEVTATVAAFPPSPVAPVPPLLRITEGELLGSYDLRGTKLSPRFDPRVDPTRPGLVLFGSADATRSVLRIERARTCAGGSGAGARCVDDTGCPGGRCAAAFEFATRMVDGVGPIVLHRPEEIHARALDPVPLEGLQQTASLNAFVVSEALAGRRVNNDEDTADHVVDLSDRVSGAPRPIGKGASTGRAVMRVRAPFLLNLPSGDRRVPFTAPEVAVDENVAAIVESEPGEYDARGDAAYNDANGNGRSTDGVLRIYRLEADGAVEVMSGVPPAVAGDALVGGASVAISDGMVFFRRSEAAEARRVTERVSVGPDGAQLSRAKTPGISADGRYVTFRTPDTLVPPDPDGFWDYFVHDRSAGITTLVSAAPDGSEGGVDQTFDPWRPAAPSRDGSRIVLQTRTPLLPALDGELAWVDDLYLREIAVGRTSLVTARPDGTAWNETTAEQAAISADGSTVCFTGDYRMVAPPLSGSPLVVRRFLTGPGGEPVAGPPMVGAPNLSGRAGFGEQCALSGDGRVVAFSSFDDDLVTGDTNDVDDAFVTDLSDPTNPTVQRVSVSSSGEQSNDYTYAVAISGDGRIVAFETRASNLVDGDTNDAADVFVHDRLTGITERVSTASDGTQADSYSDKPALSEDGRFVAFVSNATNLVPGDTNDLRDYFVKDRLTGVIERVSVAADGSQSHDDGFWDYSEAYLGLSADGQTIVFESDAADLRPSGEDTNDAPDCYVRAPDPTDVAADLFPDGILDDDVLTSVRVADGQMQSLCPARDVAVAGGRAAFLRPESATHSARCPGGSLNADDDVDDLVLHLANADGALTNLGRAATAIAMSSDFVAVLVPEAGDGDVDLDGNGNRDDTVLAVASVDPPAWLDLPARVADSVTFCGRSVVAFTSPRDAGGRRRLYVIDVSMSAPVVVDTGQSAEDLVCNAGVLAFRTRESVQASGPLNDDGDTDDDVLQVWRLDMRECLDGAAPESCLVSTKAAVRPCDRPGCDPRVPYQALGHSVRFLTFERDQGEDLSGDGDDDPANPSNWLNDVVLQTFSVHQPIEPSTRPKALGTAPAGVCLDNRNACVGDADCPGSTCFVPPGGCIEDIGTTCDPDRRVFCPEGEFCATNSTGALTCQRVDRPCRGQGDCRPDTVCRPVDEDVARFASPLTATGLGSTDFVSAGRCLETAVDRPACPAVACTVDEFCDHGVCRRDHGSCQRDGDCPPAVPCRPELSSASAADEDGDEVPDPVDNCPVVENRAQEDVDADGVGDACELCPPRPRSGCARAAVPRAGTLLLKHGSNPVLKFRWGGRPVAGAFVDPRAGGYGLCVYDERQGVPALVLAAGLPGSCSSRACWAAVSGGYRYANKRDANGMQRVSLKAGARGGLDVAGKGRSLRLPALPLQQDDRVQVQVVSPAGGCWESTFSTSAPNSSVRFFARSD